MNISIPSIYKLPIITAFVAIASILIGYHIAVNNGHVKPYPQT